MKTRHAWLYGTALAAVAAATPAVAQDQPAPVTDAAALDQDSGAHDIIVTARRRSARLRCP